MDKKLLVFLVCLVIIIISIVFYFFNSTRIIADSNNIIVNNYEINFDSLSLEQKIAQMIIIRGDDNTNIELMKLNMGGVFFDRQISEQDYSSSINQYKNVSLIRLFVTTDLEGAWNPFTIFKQFPGFLEINNSEEAYEIGLRGGKLLKKLGFNLNFAPVAEFDDKIYGGRVFLGNKSEIKAKLENYINGLQKGAYGTCKHYPGKGMINNLHLMKDEQEITQDDLELFEVCFKNNISSIMIGHQIVNGELNSNGKPSSVSEEIISSLGNFSGLVISDEINMQGLKLFYKNKVEIYKDLINSGENLILDFDLNVRSADKLIDSIAREVKEGKISEENINKSVKKILIAKGYKIR